jgi:hypothetical protein
MKFPHYIHKAAHSQFVLSIQNLNNKIPIIRPTSRKLLPLETFTKLLSPRFTQEEEKSETSISSFQMNILFMFSNILTRVQLHVQPFSNFSSLHTPILLTFHQTIFSHTFGKSIFGHSKGKNRERARGKVF